MWSGWAVQTGANGRRTDALDYGLRSGDGLLSGLDSGCWHSYGMQCVLVFDPYSARSSFQHATHVHVPAQVRLCSIDL